MTSKEEVVLQSDDRILLKYLCDEVDRSYRDSVVERKKLHEIEWKGDEDLPSVLGETEVYSDNVIGIVYGLLNYSYNKIDLDVLAKQSTHTSEALHKWLMKDSVDFPKFSEYLYSIDHLRATAYRIVFQKVLQQK